MTNFDEIFWMVGERHGVTVWYEIFDSDLFIEVIEEILRQNGIGWNDDDDLFDLVDLQVEGFSDWYGEMAGDL